MTIMDIGSSSLYYHREIKYDPWVIENIYNTHLEAGYHHTSFYIYINHLEKQPKVNFTSINA